MQVADGGDSLEIRRLVADVLNMELRRAEKGWSSNLGSRTWGRQPLTL